MDAGVWSEWREEFPKIKKRPMALSSRGTPEQPSPRTAQPESTIFLFWCKSHIGANGWHEMAIFAYFLIVDP
jgi:hypothetical protein